MFSEQAFRVMAAALAKLSVNTSKFRWIYPAENGHVFPDIGECREEAGRYRFDLRFAIPKPFDPADALALEADITVPLTVTFDGLCYLGSDQHPTLLPTQAYINLSQLEEWRDV